MMSSKRPRSNSVVDLTSSSPTLPHPSPSQPVGSRADSPTPYTSSRTAPTSKRRRHSVRIIDIIDPPEGTLHGPIAGPSHTPHEVINLTRGQEDDNHDSDLLQKFTTAKRTQDLDAVAGPAHPSVPTRLSSPVSGTRPPTPPPSNLLATHACPICFSTVTNACLTPCGHVLCGACLFAAVKSGIQRALNMGVPLGRDGTAARCPVCRTLLKDWDGRGKGIIPLKIRTVVAL